MNEEDIQHFFARIDRLVPGQEPVFGKMNLNQMICHCTDFFRMAKGTKKATVYGKVDPKEIMALASSGKSVPVPNGFGQVEGEGTRPTNLENDIRLLKEHILEFSTFSKTHRFAQHPYFGTITGKRWMRLAKYHLHHHLSQFQV